MSVKFETLVEGDILYDCHREKMGNTTTSAWVLFKVRVVSIDREKRSAQCSWNGNPPLTYYAHSFKALSRKVPKKYTDQQERRRRNGW